MLDFQSIGVAIKTSLQSYNGFLCVLLLLLLLSALGFDASRRVKPTFYSWVLAIIVVLFLTFSIGPDKYPYYVSYKRIALNGLPINWLDRSDPGWSGLTFILSKFCINEVGYFFIIATFYVFANRYFCLKQSLNSNYLFVAVVMFMGFYAYGVNTIRAGVALSILLIAITKLDSSKWLFIVIAIGAILVHKSIVIPAIAFLIASYYDKPKVYLIIWGFCLIISFIFGDIAKTYIIQYLGEEDERIISYLGVSKHGYYKIGFRWDFIAYSLFPMVIGFYHIWKEYCIDKAYKRLFNVYVLANAFWLLVISVPFSDRFAYLSWFLYPYVLLLPYLNRAEYPQIRKALMITILIGGFNIIMNFIRW